jgi:hypothetical protein
VTRITDALIGSKWLCFRHFGNSTLHTTIESVEHRMRAFESMALRIFGTKRGKVIEGGVNCIMRSFITCTPRQI